jgi:transcription elongation GreA/GreB family factor
VPNYRWAQVWAVYIDDDEVKIGDQVKVETSTGEVSERKVIGITDYELKSGKIRKIATVS